MSSNPSSATHSPISSPRYNSTLLSLLKYPTNLNSSILPSTSPPLSPYPPSPSNSFLLLINISYNYLYLLYYHNQYSLINHSHISSLILFNYEYTLVTILLLSTVLPSYYYTLFFLAPIINSSHLIFLIFHAIHLYSILYSHRKFHSITILQLYTKLNSNSYFFLLNIITYHY